MPPISSSPVDTRATRLEIRQVQPYVITQTIADISTTYTTTLTLGTYTLPPSPTSTSPPAVTETVASPPPPAKTTTDSSGVVVGAVLGSFLGLAVLLALMWKCCFDGRSVLWNPGYEEDGSYRSGSGSGSPSLGSSRSSRSRRRVKRRGGFLVGRRRRGERRHVEVRTPERVHVRRERDGFEGFGFDEGWDEKRGAGRTVVRDGMVGWSFGGPERKGERRSSRRSSRRRDWIESEKIRMRYTTDD